MDSKSELRVSLMISV